MLQLKNLIGGVNSKCPENTYMCQPPSNYMGVCIKNGENCDDEYDEIKAEIPELIWEDNEEDKIPS